MRYCKHSRQGERLVVNLEIVGPMGGGVAQGGHSGGGVGAAHDSAAGYKNVTLR